MSKLLKDTKGLSLVELVVAIAVTAILSTSIGLFFIIFVKNYEGTKDNLDIQYEAQVSLNEMTRIAMESKGISHVNTLEASGVSGVITNPIMVAFESEDDGGNTIYHVFSYNNNTVYYDDTTDASTYNQYEFANNISNFIIEPSPYNTDNFSETNSIKIIFEIKKGDAKLDVNTVVKFRNKVD